MADTFAIRTKFLRGQMLVLDDSNQKDLRIQILQIISLSACQEPIHTARYDHSLFGADKHSWTFRLYILEHLTIILIIQGI
jgi:hypothetical protein